MKPNTQITPPPVTGPQAAQAAPLPTPPPVTGPQATQAAPLPTPPPVTGPQAAQAAARPATTGPQAAKAAARPAPPPPMKPEEELLLTAGPAVVGAVFGVLLLLVISMFVLGQPGGLGALNTAVFGPQSAWHLSRATAFAAYLLIWLAMAWGLLLTNKLARAWPGGPTAADLHEHASLLGLAFGALHAIVLLADGYIGYTLPQLLIPFAAWGYKPFEVGLGQLGFYLLLPITFSFYVRRQIGTKTWRMIHLTTYLAFVLALVHGLTSGTDSDAPWALFMYLVTGVSIAGLTAYRVLFEPEPAREARSRV